jgi:hypothetical protein
MSFEPWSTARPSETPINALSKLKKVLTGNLFQAVTGQLGKALEGSTLGLGMLKPVIESFV